MVDRSWADFGVSLNEVYQLPPPVLDPFALLITFLFQANVRKAASHRAQKDKADWSELFFSSSLLLGHLLMSELFHVLPYITILPHNHSPVPFFVCCVFSDRRLSDLKYWEVSSAADGGASHCFRRSVTLPPHGKCSKFSIKFAAVPVCWSH